MDRKITHVSGNMYKLVAKPSIEEFFEAAIHGELDLELAKENIIYNPGKPTGITLTR